MDGLMDVRLHEGMHSSLHVQTDPFLLSSCGRAGYVWNTCVHCILYAVAPESTIPTADFVVRPCRYLRNSFNPIRWNN
jgi:hypothetical protein